MICPICSEICTCREINFAHRKGWHTNEVCPHGENNTSISEAYIARRDGYIQAALTGLIANSQRWTSSDPNDNPEYMQIADKAVFYADEALMEALESEAKAFDKYSQRKKILEEIKNRSK